MTIRTKFSNTSYKFVYIKYFYVRGVILLRILLEDLLKLQPLNKAQILAGEKGLKKPIDLFGVLEAPDSFNFVKNNEKHKTTG
jgi:hypothetical protein